MSAHLNVTIIVRIFRVLLPLLWVLLVLLLVETAHGENAATQSSSSAEAVFEKCKNEWSWAKDPRAQSAKAAIDLIYSMLGELAKGAITGDLSPDVIENGITSNDLISLRAALTTGNNLLLTQVGITPFLGVFIVPKSINGGTIKFADLPKFQDQIIAAFGENGAAIFAAMNCVATDALVFDGLAMIRLTSWLPADKQKGYYGAHAFSLAQFLGYAMSYCRNQGWAKPCTDCSGRQSSSSGSSANGSADCATSSSEAPSVSSSSSSTSSAEESSSSSYDYQYNLSSYDYQSNSSSYDYRNDSFSGEY